MELKVLPTGELYSDETFNIQWNLSCQVHCTWLILMLFYLFQGSFAENLAFLLDALKSGKQVYNNTVT